MSNIVADIKKKSKIIIKNNFGYCYYNSFVKTKTTFQKVMLLQNY